MLIARELGTWWLAACRLAEVEDVHARQSINSAMQAKGTVKPESPCGPHRLAAIQIL